MCIIKINRHRPLLVPVNWILFTRVTPWLLLLSLLLRFWRARHCVILPKPPNVFHPQSSLFFRPTRTRAACDTSITRVFVSKEFICNCLNVTSHCFDPTIKRAGGNTGDTGKIMCAFSFPAYARKILADSHCFPSDKQ